MATTVTDATRPGLGRSGFFVPFAFPVLLGLVCLLGGLSLSFSAVGHVAGLAADDTVATNLMAMAQPASPELTSMLGPAARSVDNLTFFLTIIGTAVAAILLLVAAGFFLSSGRLRHPDAARRVAGVALWLALGIAVINVIPFDAGWSDASLGSPGASIGEGVRTGVIAVAGLLLLQISAPQWFSSVRDAFRD